MSTEQADRTARNILELVQARRQLDAVRAALEADRDRSADYSSVDLHGMLIDDLVDALVPQPASTSSDPREVTA